MHEEIDQKSFMTNQIIQESVKNQKDDRRIQVKDQVSHSHKTNIWFNTNVYPYQAICQLHTFSSKHKGKINRGTGFLISKNIVLTCGHNLYNHTDNVQFDSAKLIFGEAQQIRTYEVKKQNMHFPEKFKGYQNDNSNKFYEYAIIKIPEVQNIIPLQLEFNYSPLQSHYIFGCLAGFPIQVYKMNKIQKKLSQQHVMYEDLDAYQIREEQLVQLNTKNIIKKKFVYHEIDTTKGNSGSPIFNYANGEIKVIGIHFLNGLGSNYDSRNQGLLLHDQILSFIDSKGLKLQKTFEGTPHPRFKTLNGEEQIPFGTLFQLNGNNHKLSQSELKDIFQMKELRLLNLNNIYFQGKIPDNIGNLKRLILLEMEDNLITQIPDGIKKILNLKYLKLRNNKITNFPEIWDLQYLKQVDLSLNNLQNIFFKTASNQKKWLLPKNIKMINISKNKSIKDLRFQIYKWKHEIQLNMQDCELYKLAFNQLPEICEYNQVILYNNNMTQNQLKNLSRLHWDLIDKLKIEQDVKQQLINIKNLQPPIQFE